MSLRLLWCSLALAGAGLGCSVTNVDHCGNREGDVTCQLQGGDAPYCSLCVAVNNGCVDAPPEESCRRESDSAAPPVETSTGAPSTTETVDPTTVGVSATGTGTSTGSSTTEAMTTSTSTSTSTSTDTTTDTTTTEATGTSTTTGSTTSTSTGDTTGDTTSETTGTTASSGSTTMEPGPMCGDGNVDQDENCEVGDLQGKKCTDFGEYGGGTLTCTACDFDYSGCCLLAGSGCIQHSDCCAGKQCLLDGLTLKKICK